MHSATALTQLERVVLSRYSTVSVVDDDPSIRAALDNLLKSQGHIVHTFASAEDFLRSSQLNDTSCVIADVQMPTMSGFELLEQMRAQGHAAPFILITAFADDRTRARALSVGVSGFFAKPFAGLELIACLDEALREHRGGTDA
ncbi:response regulator [Bradyrhizobium sp. S3.5.5]|uniref:response regulator transcription factor n=1 Tax=unclassified Bradyrhizobium TaxID=2631580 RepID=UPI0033923DE4